MKNVNTFSMRQMGRTQHTCLESGLDSSQLGLNARPSSPPFLPVFFSISAACQCSRLEKTFALAKQNIQIANTQIHRQTHTHKHTQTGRHTPTGSSHPQNLCAHTVRVGERERERQRRQSNAERELEHSPNISAKNYAILLLFVAKYPIIAAYAIETEAQQMNFQAQHKL